MQQSDDSSSSSSAASRSGPPTLKERNAVQRLVDQLLDELAPERILKRADLPPTPVTSFRTPSGCVLQGANEALSVSWFADPSDQATIGELQIVLWKGTVSRRGAARPATNAVVQKELVLHPVERPADESVWRAADGTLFDSDRLAAHCLAMLEGQRDSTG